MKLIYLKKGCKNDVVNGHVVLFAMSNKIAHALQEDLHLHFWGGSLNSVPNFYTFFLFVASK